MSDQINTNNEEAKLRTIDFIGEPARSMLLYALYDTQRYLYEGFKKFPGMNEGGNINA